MPIISHYDTHDIQKTVQTEIPHLVEIGPSQRYPQLTLFELVDQKTSSKREFAVYPSGLEDRITLSTVQIYLEPGGPSEMFNGGLVALESIYDPELRTVLFSSWQSMYKHDDLREIFGSEEQVQSFIERYRPARKELMRYALGIFNAMSAEKIYYGLVGDGIRNDQNFNILRNVCREYNYREDTEPASTSVRFSASIQEYPPSGVFNIDGLCGNCTRMAISGGKGAIIAEGYDLLSRGKPDGQVHIVKESTHEPLCRHHVYGDKRPFPTILYGKIFG